jgi:hypothetical protein
VKIVPCQALLEKLYGKALRGMEKTKRSKLCVDFLLNREPAALWMSNLYVETHSGGKDTGQASGRPIFKAEFPKSFNKLGRVAGGLFICGTVGNNVHKK